MSEEEVSVIVFGTPLVPLDHDELPTKKPIQLQDQKVYDENGLQRFHGAFTGGFSAGYFNTVGTKEGWAPSEFISSRAQKADKNRQRPEDFMDAEDLREYGIAPKRIQTTEQFRTEGKVQPKSCQKGPEIIPGIAPLADIIRPVSESMGVVLLSKLGWRQGQGIGPKRKIGTSAEKVYGCALPSSFQGDPGEEIQHESALNYTFAPRDVNILPYTPKDNIHGLGYVPLDRSQLSSVSLVLAESISGHVGSGSGKRKVAFRGQAFGVGAFEDDDDDIYVKDDISRYDFVLGGEPVDSKPSAKSNAAIKLKQSEFGQPCVMGFIVPLHATNYKKKNFPPPNLPPGYIPKSYQTTPAPISESCTNTSGVGRGRFLNRFAVSAVDRVKMLGNRFQDTSSRSTKETTSTTSRNDDNTLRLKISSEQSEQVTPIMKTECDNDNKTESLPLLRIPTVLSTRFVSSCLLEEGDTGYGLSRPSTFKPKLEPTNELIQVVDHKCQRLIEEWHPIPLICKRFNVPNPYPQSTTVGTLTSIAKGQSSQKPSIFRSLFEPIPIKVINIEDDTTTNNITHSDQKDTLERSLNLVKIVTTEWEQSQLKEISETSEPVVDWRPPTPPTMDLFNAIFQNSSSDESDQSEAEESQPVIQDESVTVNEPSEAVSVPQFKQESPVVIPIQEIVDLSPDLYGPSLPPGGSVLVVSPSVSLRSSSAARDVSKHRGTKRKKSHHKKHKKHKKKKSKRVKVSSDSESDSDKNDSDSEDDINIRLINRLKLMKKR